MDEKRKILVVDDEKDLVKVVKFRLEKKGYAVLTAYDGRDALQILENTKPDLIVLDINMPVMGGIEFYHTICSGDSAPRYPVLVLTARGELKDLFKEINADGFMPKPFEIDDLYHEIDLIIKKRYGIPDSQPKRSDNVPKKVLLVDENRDSFSRIAVAFLNDGYVVNGANTGMATIEKIFADMPDILVIRLGLSDLPGDIVVAKLRQMPKTADLPVVLYAPEMSDPAYTVEKKICENVRISRIITSGDPALILKAAREVLNIE